MVSTINSVIELKNNKKYDEAIKLAKSEFRKTKDNCFNNEIYNCFKLQNNLEEAIKILKKMIKIEPDDLSLLKKLAYNYYLSGDYKNALKYYKIVLESEPISAENHYSTGLMYHSLKDLKNAYKYYCNAIKANPKYVAAHNNIGILYYEGKDYENALKIFKNSIAISPSNPEAYHHIGIIQRIYKKDEELSVLYLKKAIRLDPKYAGNYYQLALTYNSFKRNKKAIQALKKCIELNPNYEHAKELLEKLS
ncbi:tetratricopeptide repeat protein [bacterium]|nr:tetratricopeptide repeat protein [bacterium]